MPSITLNSSYKKNTGLIISPQELLTLYFYGIDIKSKDGTSISPQTIETYIEAAQNEIEIYFNIKLFPKLITETKNYYRDDYENGFPFVSTSLPVNTPYSFTGKINTVDQIRYPKEWITNKQGNDRTIIPYCRISIVPNGSVVNADADVIYTGVSSYYGLRSYPQVPDYWTVQYDTGFDPFDFPKDILNMIGMMASIPLLGIAGDLILGAGIASQSISLDGLSQSVNSISSATNSGYGARIVEYRKTLKETINRIKGSYRGQGFAVC